MKILEIMPSSSGIMRNLKTHTIETKFYQKFNEIHVYKILPFRTLRPSYPEGGVGEGLAQYGKLFGIWKYFRIYLSN